MTERINNSESKQYKVVFPNTLNDHDTLFGGIAMQWMDEEAYITATGFTRMKMVTVSTGKIHFRNAIKSGSIAEIMGKVVKVGNVKVGIRVEITVEEMYTNKKNSRTKQTTYRIS